MTKRELWIRTDANKEIGMGHMMRCLTIAEAAGRAGIRTLFFIADEEAGPLLRARRQEYRVLHTDFADMEAELPRLFWEMEAAGQQAIKESPTIGERPETVLLADSYRITQAYLQQLKQKLSEENIRLALMEDYGNVPFQADILINYNIYGPDFSYENNAPKRLLGCAYMPLRQEFVRQSYTVREQTEHILITTGGSDSCRIAEKLVKILTNPEEARPKAMRHKEMHLHVICGKFSESLQALRELEGGKALTVYTDVKNMWELMAACDLAVSAAGTTLYELCAVGVPTVCFSFADNQILPGKAFEKYTPVIYAGDYEKNQTEMFTRIAEQVTLFREMPQAERAVISEKMRKLVDGKGAERIIEALWS